MTVNVKIFMMGDVIFCFKTKAAATEYSYRLLQCCDPQFWLSCREKARVSERHTELSMLFNNT